MSWILSYGCTSSVGLSTAALWQSLTQVRPDFSQQVNSWPTLGTSDGRPSFRQTLLQHLLFSWQEVLNGLNPAVQSRIQTSGRLGVILASTKSFIDDFIWKSDPPELDRDALTPLLEDFLRETKLCPIKHLCLSNACASSISALYLAERWLGSGQVSDVLILAADMAGPFVLKGFDTLKVLSPDATRPFSGKRSGFSLGDASACLLLSNLKPDGQPGLNPGVKAQRQTALFLEGVGIEAEGHAVTRPSQSGDSLRRACLQIESLESQPPDLIIAHGTATQINDATEDLVYSSLFSQVERRPYITASKWKTGHTLGACGALDAILACESIRQNTTFRIASTPEIDSQFRGCYLSADANLQILPEINRVLFSSLGFGGIHAAALISQRAIP